MCCFKTGWRKEECLLFMDVELDGLPLLIQPWWVYLLSRVTLLSVYVLRWYYLYWLIRKGKINFLTSFSSTYLFGLPRWLSGKESACLYRRHKRLVGSVPVLGKIPWSRKWQPTPAFLPGKSHGQRSLAGYSLGSRKRVGHDLLTKRQQPFKPRQL